MGIGSRGSRLPFGVGRNITSSDERERTQMVRVSWYCHWRHLRSVSCMGGFAY